jgi:hypothetical protein
MPLHATSLSGNGDVYVHCSGSVPNASNLTTSGL